MTFITGLIIGLIVGWIIEWIIDWQFWRRDDEQIRLQLKECEARLKSLEARQAAATDAQSEPRQEDPLENINGVGPVFAKRLKEAGIYTFLDLAQTVPNSIRDIVSAEEQPKIEPEKWVAEARKIVGWKIDKLETINGIGPKFATRLNGVGVYTFAELAELTPDRIKEALDTEEWQKIEPDKWIAEARELAQKGDTA